MSNLDRALAEISAIRGQMARASEFRGYGPRTFAITGLLALVAAFSQTFLVRDPATHIEAYLILWGGTAVLSAVIVGVEMVTRSRRHHSNLADEMIHAAIEHFLPSAVAGALLTLVLIRYAPQSLWMLPGLWQILFGLGVFASCRFLPRSVIAGRRSGIWPPAWPAWPWRRATAPFRPGPWGFPFGAGQWLAAILLQRGLAFGRRA